jgi:hypothetical protein
MHLTLVVCTVSSLLVFHSTASLPILEVWPCDIRPETNKKKGHATNLLRVLLLLMAICGVQTMVLPATNTVVLLMITSEAR